MNKIAITGSEGTIGSVLHAGLGKEYEVLGLDLPEYDVRDYDLLLHQFQTFGPDTVIHVAHDMHENCESGSIVPDNVTMEMNIFEAATEASVGRVIMASSVHADDFLSYTGDKLLSVPGSYRPTSPYGAHKLALESIGASYNEKTDLEFVAIRFGGVTPDDSVRTYDREPAVWLSHRDLLGAVGAAVKAMEVPGGHGVFYAVSDNTGRLHDTANPFGWTPQDNSYDRLHL